MSFVKPGLFHSFSKNAHRSSFESSKVARSCAAWRNPLGDVFSVSHIASNSALSFACSSGVIGALLSGVHQLAVRWYTVREATSPAMAGISWTPLDPVPMTATRLSAKSTGVAGHNPVWYDSPRKSSRPGTSGKYGTERTPVAAMKNCARNAVPSPTTTVHFPDDSSYAAEVTLAPNRMWRRRSNRSTTWLR